ncbi:MAG: PAS domain-containing protein [Thermoflexales bacterium]|nr:PAS domain-containing protein [Thermoflexales bacterium]
MKINVSQWLDVSSADPDDARRRKLLNILLLGSATLMLAALLIMTMVVLFGLVKLTDSLWLYLMGIAVLSGITIIFLINRYGPGWLASSIFLALLAAAIAFSDDPNQVVQGRSLFLLTIPILMASVLLRPYASFVAASLTGLLLAIIARTGAPLELGTIPFTTIGLIAVAFVAWLAARSLENTLRDLRLLNEELEQRVQDRTHELAEAWGRNQAILESIADGVVVFDNDGRATMINPSISQLLDRSEIDIVDSDLTTLLGENVSEADRQTIVELFKDKEERHPSVKFGWGRKTLSVSLAPVRTEPDQVAGTVAVFRDFTREAEVDRMKSAIVSMVSHDLRTPLNAIMGYSEMLQELVYGELTTKQMGTLQRITANAKRLLSLVNDLLDQAQIEAGRMALKIGPFDPAELLDGLQSVMGVLAETKDLTLTGEVEDNLPTPLQGDPQRLHQILVNLVGNALKFTEHGGVHVRFYRVDEAHWAMAVSDTGPGISPDKLDRVFERFYQVEGDITTRKYQGIGLGLAIVKQLVELMGGWVGVESQVGEGSAFMATIPFVPPPIENSS